MAEPLDDLTLLALAAKAGDRDAASTFVRTSERDLRAFLRHICDPGHVEDLAQETYLRALRALPRFDARSTAKTWLFAIARRVAADEVRAATRRPRAAATGTWEALAERASAHPGPLLDEAVAIRHLMLELDPDRREAFALTQVSGLSYAEAAEVCGCPIGTIRSRVARAREDLIALLRAEQRGDHRRTTRPSPAGSRPTTVDGRAPNNTVAASAVRRRAGSG